MNNHNQSILRRFSSQRTQIHRGPCDEKRSIWLRHTATSFITYHLYWLLWAQPCQAQLHQNDPSTSQHQSATLITSSNPPSIRSCWRDATTFLPAKLSATAGSGRNTFGWHTTMGHPSASCVTKLAKSGILLRVAKVDELYWIVTITCVELPWITMNYLNIPVPKLIRDDLPLDPKTAPCLPPPPGEPNRKEALRVFRGLWHLGSDSLQIPTLCIGLPTWSHHRTFS